MTGWNSNARRGAAAELRILHSEFGALMIPDSPVR